MEYLGSLESTQEARVALGYASGNSYASFVLSKLPACSITRQCTLKHEPIVNYHIASKAAQSDSVYVSVLKIPIVLADGVSKFCFSRERPLSTRGKTYFATIMDANRDSTH